MSSRINLPHGDKVAEGRGHGNRVLCKCLQNHGCGGVLCPATERYWAVEGSEAVRHLILSEEPTFVSACRLTVADHAGYPQPEARRKRVGILLRGKGPVCCISTCSVSIYFYMSGLKWFFVPPPSAIKLPPGCRLAHMSTYGAYPAIWGRSAATAPQPLAVAFFSFNTQLQQGDCCFTGRPLAFDLRLSPRRPAPGEDRVLFLPGKAYSAKIPTCCMVLAADGSNNTVCGSASAAFEP
jgi:hypothetical protein